jgi:hypothetical protein
MRSNYEDKLKLCQQQLQLATANLSQQLQQQQEPFDENGRDLPNGMSRSQCYKTFFSMINKFLQQARVFVPGKLFQPIILFVGKARSLTQSGAAESYFSRVGSGLNCKHYTRLEKLARDGTNSLAYYEHS